MQDVGDACHGLLSSDRNTTRGEQVNGVNGARPETGRSQRNGSTLGSFGRILATNPTLAFGGVFERSLVPVNVASMPCRSGVPLSNKRGSGAAAPVLDRRLRRAPCSCGMVQIQRE